MNSIFIAGTDTGIGKTYVTTLLLKEFNKQGYKTFGMKPIASGCKRNDQNQLINTDALQLQSAASLFRPYSTVNPIALEEPIAPHIAAQKNGCTLSTRHVLKAIEDSIQEEADINLIEGVGGWAVPLNHQELLCDTIALLNIPVLLVVGIRLGCLNHAILTYRNMLQIHVPLVGWIANCVDKDMLEVDSNIETLEQWISAPRLGTIPYQSSQNEDDVSTSITPALNIKPIENYLSLTQSYLTNHI